MTAITEPPLPKDSLLARHRGLECYRDAFAIEVPGTLTLAQFITAFYSSGAFLPERLFLALLGRWASRDAIAALAQGNTKQFAAWTVEMREDALTNGESGGRWRGQILLADFRDETCSWLAVEPIGGGTRLWFGSGVRRANTSLVRALIPAHRWYSQVLLGAIRGKGN